MTVASPSLAAEGVARPAPTLRVQERFMIYGFLALPAFDFKGAATGGNAAQLLLAGLSTLCCLLFCIQRRSQPGSRPLQMFILAWWSFLALNGLTTLIGVAANLSDANLDTYIRSVTPFVLFGTSLSMIQAFVRKGYGIEIFVRPFLVAGLISIPFHFIYARVGLNIDTEMLRFQAQTPFLTPTLAAAMLALLVHRRVSPVLVVAVVLTLASIALTITRSYILVIAIMIPPALYVLARSSTMRTAEKAARVVRVGFFSFALFFVAIFMTILIRPNTIVTWNQRLFGHKTSHVDPSLLEREMNRSGVLLEIQKSTYVTALGKGFGGTFIPDMRYAPEFTSQVGRVITTPLTSMDSRPMNSLLSTGVIGTAFQGLLYLMAYLYAFRSIRYQSSAPESRGLWASWAFVSLIGYIPTFYAYDIFGSRSDALVLGLMFALAIAFGSGRLASKPDQAT